MVTFGVVIRAGDAPVPSPLLVSMGTTAIPVVELPQLPSGTYAVALVPCTSTPIELDGRHAFGATVGVALGVAVGVAVPVAVGVGVGLGLGLGVTVGVGVGFSWVHFGHGSQAASIVMVMASAKARYEFEDRDPI